MGRFGGVQASLYRGARSLEQTDGAVEARVRPAVSTSPEDKAGGTR